MSQDVPFPSNAAGHLARLLEAYVDGIGNGKQHKVVDRWAHVLRIDNATVVSVLPYYVPVLGLLTSARSDLELLPDMDTKSDMSVGLTRVENLLAGTPLSSPNSVTYVKVLVQDKSTLPALRNLAGWTSQVLDRPVREPTDADDVDEIRRQLEQLWDQVSADAELEPDVQDFLLRRIAGLIDALRRYRVDGVGAFQDEQDRFQGEIERRPGLASRARATKYFKAAKDLLVALAAAADIYTGMIGGPAALTTGTPAIEAPAEAGVEDSVGESTDEESDDADE